MIYYPSNLMLRRKFIDLDSVVKVVKVTIYYPFNASRKNHRFGF